MVNKDICHWIGVCFKLIKVGAKATGTDMNNHKHFRAFALVLLLSVPLAACSTTDAVPKDYKGPLAQIADSVVKTGPSSANFFYVSTVNGRLIHESLRATKQSNYGQGFRMTTATIIRKVPAEPSTFSIVGRRDYAAPILALVRKVYEVKGETTFTPLPDRIYVVNGTLGDDYSAVWIEEAATGTVIGQKVEVKGSSTLGILEK